MNEAAELESLYTVLAFDPGGTTGWAVICVEDGVIGPPPFDLWKNGYEGEPGTEAEWNEAAKLAYKAEVEDCAQYRILDNIRFWSCGQFTGDRGDQVDMMMELTLAWPNSCALVIEGFILREFRMDAMLLEPVRVTERYRHAIRDTGPHGTAWRSPGVRAFKRDVIQQPPALAKSMVTDERLRKMPVPFYNGTSGKPHARDAVRHALTFLRREKEARSLERTLHVC